MQDVELHNRQLIITNTSMLASVQYTDFDTPYVVNALNDTTNCDYGHE